MTLAEKFADLEPGESFTFLAGQSIAADFVDGPEFDILEVFEDGAVTFVKKVSNRES